MTEDDIARLDSLEAQARERVKEAREALSAATAEAGSFAKQAKMARLKARNIKPGDPVTLTVRDHGGRVTHVNAFLRVFSDWRGIEWAAETATGRMALRKAPDYCGQVVDFHKRDAK